MTSASNYRYSLSAQPSLLLYVYILVEMEFRRCRCMPLGSLLKTHLQSFATLRESKFEIECVHRLSRLKGTASPIPSPVIGYCILASFILRTILVSYSELLENLGKAFKPTYAKALKCIV
jgi:hypothetical protein